MELPKNLKDEIWGYCRVNKISNIDEFTIKLIKQGFTIEKFGATPTPKEKIIEKIVEKIVEVPVEKIIERRVEVPVEMVDNELVQGLKDKIAEIETLKTDLSKILGINEVLLKELEIEKKKNKKDLYGEE